MYDAIIVGAHARGLRGREGGGVIQRCSYGCDCVAVGTARGSVWVWVTGGSVT